MVSRQRGNGEIFVVVGVAVLAMVYVVLSAAASKLGVKVGTLLDSILGSVICVVAYFGWLYYKSLDSGAYYTTVTERAWFWLPLFLAGMWYAWWPVLEAMSLRGVPEFFDNYNQYQDWYGTAWFRVPVLLGLLGWFGWGIYNRGSSY